MEVWLVQWADLMVVMEMKAGYLQLVIQLFGPKVLMV